MTFGCIVSSEDMNTEGPYHMQVQAALQHALVLPAYTLAMQCTAVSRVVIHKICQAFELGARRGLDVHSLGTIKDVDILQ